MSPAPLKIALVAGEASSDMLGADLIAGLKALNPEVEIIAVGGAKITATGVEVIQDNELFSVMGLMEVLKDLPQLLAGKKRILNQIIDFKPDVFIGVDSPDLNFSLAKSLKQHGIRVVHYVSPSVWAWRPKRIHKMAQFIDCLLTLFPFEVDVYQPTSIKATFVGHPLAQKIPMQVDKQAAKNALGQSNKKILALLPGSRNREINSLMPVFAAAIKKLQLGPEWTVMSSNVSDAKISRVQALAEQHNLNLNWVDEASELLKAADFALLGSGTVALEAMLCKTPMVVAYQISAVTWRIINTLKMMQLPYFSLPNVLYQDFLVPEVMQQDLTPENLAQACDTVINSEQQADLINSFTQIHKTLLPAESNLAAKSVLQFMESTC